MKKIYFTLLVNLAILCFACVASAQIVTGMAYIENNNLVKAKENARREAMRSFVEERIGVKINAESETENFILVRDHIVSRSEGYVVVKRVVSEKQQGAYYVVELDLEAGSKPIELAQADVKKMLGSLDRQSSRGSMDIAITAENMDNTWDWSNQMVACLKGAGFSRIKRNDHILQFIGQNLNLNKLQLYSELRRIGRLEGTGAKSIVRGFLKVVKPATFTGNAYTATAQASIEIIGYDSNNVDAISRYVTALGNSTVEAEMNARRLALEECANYLAEQSAVTVQYEEQGGKREIETTLMFKDITDRIGDSNNIIQSLENANCEVDRSVFTTDNTFAIAIYTQEYNKLYDVIQSVLKQIRLYYPNAINFDSEDLGATKTIIKLEGR